MFAKIFDSERDQVLVTIDRSDKGYRLLYTWETPRGIVTYSTEFANDPDGCRLAESTFDDMTEEQARTELSYMSD